MAIKNPPTTAKRAAETRTRKIPPITMGRASVLPRTQHLQDRAMLPSSPPATKPEPWSSESPTTPVIPSARNRPPKDGGTPSAPFSPSRAKCGDSSSGIDGPCKRQVYLGTSTTRLASRLLLLLCTTIRPILIAAGQRQGGITRHLPTYLRDMFQGSEVTSALCVAWKLSAKSR